MTNKIDDPWHARPLDVHRWSDHSEVGVVVDGVADYPRQSTNCRTRLYTGH
ncbi:MAG: hypothetical protein JXR00_16680 [Sulfitobacter geojensis]